MASVSDITQAWPVARQGASQAIRHPAWEEARNAVLDRAAEGPVTIALVGPAGVGKTWLLRELAGSLGDHGFPCTVLMQGDLPATLSPDAALLVDEAMQMPDAALDDLLRQRHGVVVLADLEPFADRVAVREGACVIVPLRPLDPAEVAAFATEWLARAGSLPAPLDPALTAHLVSHSQGAARRLAKLLAAPIVLPEPVALPEPIADPDPAPPLPALPPRRRAPRMAMTTLAVAACAVLAWAMRPAQPPEPVPEPSPEPRRMAQLPPAIPADLTVPDLTEPARPVPATLAAAAPLVPADLPPPAASLASSPAVAAPAAIIARAAPPALSTLLPAPVLAAGPEPATPPIASAAPAGTPTPLVASAAPAAPAATATPTPPTRAPGMVLIAQRGDTLQSLYTEIYRDRPAPPYAEILAANPRPFRPGAIVIFPEPPGGWARTH